MPLFSPTLTLPELAAALRSGEALRPPLPPRPGPTPPAAGDAHLLLAYACGTGPEVPPELVRRLLLLKAHELSLSSPDNGLLSKRLLDFYNRDVWPVLYEQGAPDTPLAHLALPLLGRGEVNYQGYRLAAADVLELFGWEPLALPPAAGPALLAGAAFALAYATEALERTARLLRTDATLAALGDSEPAAAGPAALATAARVVEAACNAPASASGLPLVFSQLAGLLAAVGEASAQRTARRLAAPPAAGEATLANLAALPAVAASLAAASRRLAAPAAPAPAEVRRVVENTEQLLGLELLAAAHGLAAPAPGGPAPAALVAAFRAIVTFAAPDQLPAPDLHRAARFVREYEGA